jgi:hypothetical protein
MTCGRCITSGSASGRRSGSCPIRRRSRMAWSSRSRPRALPQRLARLDGPRSRISCCRMCRVTSSPARSSRSAVTSALQGRRPRHRALRLRLRPLRRMPLRQPPGLREPVPARLHLLGLLRRICRHRLCRHQPRASARRTGFATAASLGCRFATSFRAVVDQAGSRPGEWVAVHGCGGVGLSAIMIASALGANVVAIDLDPAKLDFARSIGAVRRSTPAGRRRRRGGEGRSPEAARMSRSTRSATASPASTRSATCAGAAGMCRSG